jgi:YidC/Oxa1 family membrane protein insertase
MQSRDPDSQKNLMLAIVLSMLVVMGWQYFFAGPQLREQQERMAREKQAAETAGKPGTAATPGATLPGQTNGAAAPAAAAQAQAATREEALKRSPRIAIETPALKGSIALKGGLVDDLVLMKYRQKADPASPNVVLFSPAESAQAYFAKHGWLNAGPGQPKLPDGETVWKADGNEKLTPSAPVTLVWDNGEGLTFRRTISIDESYMLKVAEEVENKTQAEVVLKPFALLYRLGTPKVEGFFILHEGLIGVADHNVSWCGSFFASPLCEITYADALETSGSKSFDSKAGGWVGVTEKYWAAALIPDQGKPYTATFAGRAAVNGQKEFFTADYGLETVAVAPGQKASVTGQLYAGAKQAQVIDGYEASHGIKQFDLMIDWGWFYFITKPFNHLIHWLHGILGNFGFAILAVTVLVKAAFFPLANKSYDAMAKMKKLQPQMEELRERFKDDKAKQQQELMALYQKEKINPAAGCLPILVQIPVFFALYKVLFVSIDMRHAPFVGWIQDLSAADPTSIFNLFGLLPFGVPDFLAIGAWPVIMGLTMWLQMQLNPPQPDPVQQAMFSWMPLIFTFLLASFPAGLVIYWAWNNILSIIQQWYISKKQGVEIHLLDNIKKTFAPVGRLLGLAPPEPVPAGASGKKPPASESKTMPGGSSLPSESTADLSSQAPTTREDALRVLGLKPGAGDKQIGDAFNRLAKRLDPGDAEAKANLKIAKELALGRNKPRT